MEFMESSQALRRQISSWYQNNRMVLTQTPGLSALAPDAVNPAKWDSFCKRIAEPGVWGGARNNYYRVPHQLCSDAGADCGGKHHVSTAQVGWEHRGGMLDSETRSTEI